MSVDDWEAELSRINMQAHALAYARRGWPVFPLWWASFAGVCACREGSDCSSPAKHPLITDCYEEATTNKQQITAWWHRWPHANIGVATGKPSGFTVLDIDTNHGGDRAFWQLRSKYGTPEPTLVSLTGGGGRHILWKWHPSHKCQQSIRPGIDVRSTGGHIVMPPSLHGSGIRYEWHPKGHPRVVKIADPPPWIEHILNGVRLTGRRNGSLPKGPIAEGGRNRALFRWACRFQRDELSDEELANRVHAMNTTQCKPPLDTKEVEKIIGSALRYPKGANK